MPEQGDWYARAMYEEGSLDYRYQVAHYGHPSKVGFQEIDHLWHAEHWDTFQTLALGGLEFAQAGKQVVKVRSRDASSWKAINLASIKLTRLE